MKITLCGSIVFWDSMDEIRGRLEGLGHEVQTPSKKVKNTSGQAVDIAEYYSKSKDGIKNSDWLKKEKTRLMLEHFKKISWAEAVLVYNQDKNGISNYIGSNTLIEMGVAFYLDKKIYLLNDVPEASNSEEVYGMEPIIINSDYSKIV